MADLDTGHIFLTTLAPIKTGTPLDPDSTSFEQRVRTALAELPTARQSPATEKAKYNSPFARNLRNHFVRMFVIDDTIYNGRIVENAIKLTIQKVNTINPQPVDSLNCSYLVFCADIDAITEDGAPLPANLSSAQQKEVRRTYAKQVWDTMEEEVVEIYRNCVGFDGIDSGDGFADYLEKCHVETFMPFHDYYMELPKFNLLPVKALALLVGVPAIVGLASLVLWLFGMATVLGMPSLVTGIIGLVLAFIAIKISIWYTMRNGAKPLPPAEFDDLPSVLKSIYIQQKFSDFVVENQGATDADLHAAFGAFMAEHKPADRTGPMQKPGVISSSRPDNIINA